MELILIRILVLLFSVVAHEVAHGWMAERLGDSTAREAGRLTFNPLPHIDPVGSILVPLVLSVTGTIMLGWARPVPVNPLRLGNPRDDYPKVAAAGPLSNLLLALAFAILLGLVMALLGVPARGWGAPESGSVMRELLIEFCQVGVLINVVLALFNLMPLPPLDGSWILLRFLPPAAAVRLHQLRRHGLLLVIGLLVLLRYTVLGDLVFAVIETVFKAYLKVSVLIATLL